MRQRTVSAQEYNDVAAVAARYVEALRSGTIAALNDVFHRDCVTYGTVNGELVGGGAGNPTADFIRTHGPSPEIEAHVDVFDITPSTATVRVILEKDAVGSACSENLLLLKLEGRWTVIAKVFHQFEN